MATTRFQRLDTNHRLRIISELAGFATPKETAEVMWREFGIRVSPQRIECYDPTKSAGRRLSPHWRDLFFKIREKSRTELANIPEFHRAVRVKYLAESVNCCEERGDYAMAARLLEQIAKEMGGYYERRR